MPEIRVSEMPADAANPPAEGVAGVDLAAQLSALTAERDQLAAEKSEIQDLLQRRQAEFENFRRRTERERGDFAQYASMEIVRDLLPIVDDFDRAMKAESTDKEYARGVELIYGRMIDLLKKAGLEPIEAEGKPFDPHLHQAVEKVQTTEAPDHTILSEFQKGYFFKGKLLRPSMVKVAVRP
ncbi:nucleotide exchange factor GrpE [Nevskia soli]|uniref:nucleotide exchange factor GrpE n=1 Tax=Nevskia soli TaxID=418856 RepID=UPI0015D8A345|nr:nucleotide exchange factor GrpE [Nevskia soli]